MAKVSRYKRSCTDAVGGKRNYVWNYKIEMEEGEGNDEPDVLRVAGLPRKYDSHPRDRRAVVKSVVPTTVDNFPRMWDVAVNYDTEPVSEAEKAKDSEERPTDRPLQISWDSYGITEVVQEDESDPPKPYCTVNGEFFDPGHERENIIAVCRIVRCEAEEFDGEKMLKWGNTVNKSTFRKAPPGKVFLPPPKSTKKTEGEDEYYEVAYEFHYNRKGWKARIAHLGYKVKTACEEGEEGCVDGYKIDIARVDGVPVSQPVKLDPDGFQLADDEDPFFLEFNDFLEAEFSELGLG